MKRGIITFAVLAFALVSLASSPATAGNAKASNGETAVVEFTRTVKLMDVLLKGTYLVVHDDSRMAQGEACLYVYRPKEGKPDRLVVAYHCRPIEREPVRDFKVILSRVSTPYEIPEVLEIQFPGFSKAHRTP